MTDPAILLASHVPRLVYDSMEAYFADSAAIWTDSRYTQLRRADGTVLATAPRLSLDYLGPHAYGDGRPVLASDVIGETTRDYGAHAAAAHRDVRYRDRVHGHARRDDQGRLWLQYWCFYYYNDYQLAGPLVGGGKHEGDWEMVQIRLDGSERPVEAIYAQHRGAETHPWSYVTKAPSSADTPLVYVARGSHAAYFRPGAHWTGVWFDNADGRGPRIDPALIVLSDDQPAWVAWPGYWGDTKAGDSPFDANSPTGPARHPQWQNPAALVETAARTAAAAKPPPPAAPPPPRVSARRDGGLARVAYELPARTAGIVVAARPAGSAEPATTVTLPADSRTGEVELPLEAGREYEIHASAVAHGGAASPAVPAP
jgi:hypothetical protein